MESTSSSKVTVEYHDPAGIFSLIQNDLASRLPLRNLNWKSRTRPLRRIEALHLDFVPDSYAPATTSIAREPSGLWPSKDTRPSSTPAVAPDSVPKERRHQIPGLRQTPYLKLFILRCDDKDTYKATARQQVRDWMRASGAASQSSTAVNKLHDAFEWMIIHVVIPDTVAASEPRWRPDKKDPDELLERSQSKTKWATKSTSTVYDKLRADFNPSTKVSLERVAQIRLQKNVVPPQLLPKNPVASPYSESPQEQENAWQDLIGKFKILILQSFDARVSQYEDDIREKEVQRSLPGWNFSTFFTLKENLGRAFESVGLVEDALSIYEELSAGLESTTRDSAGPPTFLGDMSSLKRELEHLDDPDGDSKDAEGRIAHLLDSPLDLAKKDYRGLIVSSTISLFDFQTYIFARQRALLYRLGNFVPAVLTQGIADTKNKSGQTDDDLLYVAEVCKKTAAFVTSNSRLLKNELSTGSSSNPSPTFSAHLNQAASSWMYSIIDSMLEETAAPALSKGQGSPGSPNKTQPTNFNFPQGANQYPARKSSLQPSPTPSQPKSKVIYESGKMALSGGATKQEPAAPGSGLAELAAARGELYHMQRKILEDLGKSNGWVAGWAAIEPSKPITLVNLDDEEDTKHAMDAGTSPSAGTGLLGDVLASALVSLDAFQSEYEILNDLAVRHFIIADRTNAAERLLGDHALLSFQRRDYATAAQFFQKVVPKYMNQNWSYIQAEMLRVYARCLKELHRRDEFMRVTLSLLTKIVARDQAKRLPQYRSAGYLSGVDEDTVDVHGLLAEMITLSGELPYSFTAQMIDFFSDIWVGTELVLFDDKDGFQLPLQFRYLLDESIVLDRIKLRLVNVKDTSQEVWLESKGKVRLERGLTKLDLFSNVSCFGHFSVDRLTLEVDKLHFIHDFQEKPRRTPLGFAVPEGPDAKQTPTSSSVLLYPRDHALGARMTLCPDIHIDKRRSLHVTLDSGSQDLTRVDVRVKAASAGLRLNTADTTIVQGHVPDLDLATGGTIKLGSTPAEQSLVFRLPYTLENDLREIKVRLEITYAKAEETFLFLSIETISTELPLDVDVSDMFRGHALFSKFSVRTVSSSPLLIRTVTLSPSAVYNVVSMPCPPNMAVFEKQPACLTYKITKKDSVGTSTVSKADAALALDVDYCCIDAIVQHSLEKQLLEDLSHSDHGRLTRLLMSLLHDNRHNIFSSSALESAVLLQKVVVPSYESLNWDAAIGTLAERQRASLQAWLREWHATHPYLPLSADSPPQSCNRTITLSVDVPMVDFLHTVSLELQNCARTTTRMPPLVKVGQPITAELRIKSTRAWSAAQCLGPAAPTEQETEFVYTVQEASDTWLVGGQKRAKFSITDGEEISYSLLLIPMTPGTHLLPYIDIQPAAKSDGSGAADQPGITSEVDYRSATETVLVVKDTRGVTATILESASDRMGIERASSESRASRIIA